jgi:transcriptional regulator with XRE-family HTH domain
MRNEHFERVARQMLRAIRGSRSQAILSRRLGFSSNVASKWESGQRMPTAAEALAYGQRLGHDPWAALCALNPNAAGELGERDSPNLGAWLRALRGSTPLGQVAERSGLSRFSVSRFLSGRSVPRLPQFLALLDALTDRLEDFVDAWLGIANVPLLEPRFARTRAARDALFERPLCLSVLCLLDTVALNAPKAEQLRRLSAALEHPPKLIRQCVDTLSRGGVISLVKDRYALSGALTVDAHSTRERELAARSYWTKVAHERTRDPMPLDVCSYNVFSIGRRDYAKLQQLQREFYRGARALVAASAPTELAGLMVVQLIAWDPEQERDSNPPWPSEQA